jgi:hypothetical protein
MLAELHARWEREDEMARKMKVCTITTSSDVVSNASNPLTLIGVEKTPTPCAKKPKTLKTFSTKSAKIDKGSIATSPNIVPPPYVLKLGQFCFEVPPDDDVKSNFGTPPMMFHVRQGAAAKDI